RAAGMYPRDHRCVRRTPEDIDDAGSGRGKLHISRPLRQVEREETHPDRRRRVLLDDIELISERQGMCGGKHAESSRSADRNRKIRVAYPAAHRGELQRKPAADEM